MDDNFDPVLLLLELTMGLLIDLQPTPSSIHFSLAIQALDHMEQQLS